MIKFDDKHSTLILKLLVLGICLYIPCFYYKSPEAIVSLFCGIVYAITGYKFIH